jgi:hypothetical protein
MLARPPLTKQTQPTVEKQNSQGRPVDERFLLRVDGQTKRSFSNKEPAITAGSAIKKAFPIVMVTIEDTADGSIDVVKV